MSTRRAPMPAPPAAQSRPTCAGVRPFRPSGSRRTTCVLSRGWRVHPGKVSMLRRKCRSKQLISNCGRSSPASSPGVSTLSAADPTSCGGESPNRPRTIVAARRAHLHGAVGHPPEVGVRQRPHPRYPPTQSTHGIRRASPVPPISRFRTTLLQFFNHRGRCSGCTTAPRA